MNELTKGLADKRRLLRDEEAKYHEIERKIREKQAQECTLAERLKNEYDDLRQCFEKMAFELRFSIEDELRIYARLLDELMKKSTIHSSQSTHTITSSSTIRSAGIEDHLTAGGMFDIGNSQSEWTRSGNISTSAGNLYQADETEVQETFDGGSVIRSTSFH